MMTTARTLVLVGGLLAAAAASAQHRSHCNNNVNVVDFAPQPGCGPSQVVHHGTRGRVQNVGNERVVGGDDAVTPYPWLAQLVLMREAPDGSGSEAYMCGASMITDRIALTAAHCFFGEDGANMQFDFSTSKVYVGIYGEVDKYNPGNGHVLRHIGCVTYHSGYNHMTNENDIALVHLDEALPEGWETISLDVNVDRNEADTANVGTVLGWGSLVDAAVPGELVLPNALQEASVNIQSNAECRGMGSAYDTWVTDSMMCTYTVGADACQGDSGGPLIVTLGDGSVVQTGIISWGIGCARVNHPGVHTRVHSYRNWISTTVFELQSFEGCTGNSNQITSGGELQTSTSIGGCTCSFAWAIGSTTCASTTGRVFNGCNMIQPCDGDNGGTAGQSWCILDSNEGCSPAGTNWDYCVPSETTTSTSSTTSTTTSTTTSSTSTSTTTEPPTPSPTMDPTTSQPTSSAPTSMPTRSPMSVNNFFGEPETTAAAVTNEYPAGFVEIGAGEGELCDLDGGNTRSAIRALPGRGTTPETCAEWCESMFDCLYFHLNSQGRCNFLADCEVRETSDGGKIWQRLSEPTTLAPSITEGYSDQGLGRWCDRTAANFSWSGRRSLGGGGKTLLQCVTACSRRRDCLFFSLTGSGYCHLYQDCPATVNHKTATMLYSRDRYKMESQVLRCDKREIIMRSVGGQGQTYDECVARCEGWEHCSHIVWYSLKGYCHQFTSCPEDKKIEAQGGSTIYSRTTGSRVPLLEGWDIVTTTERCDLDSPNNIKSVSLPDTSKGSTAQMCVDECAPDEACTSFSWYTKTGVCIFWDHCEVMNSYRSITYRKMVPTLAPTPAPTLTTSQDREWFDAGDRK